MSNLSDRILVRDLRIRCIVGINDEERVKQQDVIINLSMDVDLKKAGDTDEFSHTVDYKELKQDIYAMVEKSEYFLIEAMAEKVASIVLSREKVKSVTVTVDKPGALRFAESVAVEITRSR